MAAAAQAAHEALVEMVAEGDDALMQEFFDEGTLPVPDLKRGLREALWSRRLSPVLVASGLHNIGADAILDLAVEMLPAPSVRSPATASNQAVDGDDVRRAIRDSEPLSLFAYKTLADPFAGRVTYFKVMSGVLKNDATVQNFLREQGGAVSASADHAGEDRHTGDRAPCRRSRVRSRSSRTR